MKTKSLTRLTLTAATTLTATLAVLMAYPDAADAACISPSSCTVDINGTTYSISTINNTFANIKATLQNEPWAIGTPSQNFAAAQDAGQLVKDVFGSPNFSSPLPPGTPSVTVGLFFAYDLKLSYNPILGRDVVGGVVSYSTHVASAYADFGVDPNASVTWATATAIPTPAMLPGLIGVCAAAWRKRKLASSTHA